MILWKKYKVEDLIAWLVAYIMLLVNSWQKVLFEIIIRFCKRHYMLWKFPHILLNIVPAFYFGNFVTFLSHYNYNNKVRIFYRD